MPVGVDSPLHFDFDAFVNTIVPRGARDARRSETRASRTVRRHTSADASNKLGRTRGTRSCSSLQPFAQALASFLRLIARRRAGTAISPQRSPAMGGRVPSEQYLDGGKATHQITILDLSQLASEVLENVTALHWPARPRVHAA